MLVDLECIQAFRNHGGENHYFKDPLKLLVLLSSAVSLQIYLPVNTKLRFLVDKDTYEVLKNNNPLGEDLTCFWDSVEVTDFENLPVDFKYYSLPKLYSMCRASTACFVVDCDTILQKPVESFWNSSQVFGNTYKIHHLPEVDLLGSFKDLGSFPIKRSNYFQGSFYYFPSGGLARTVGIGSIGFNLALWNRESCTVNVVEEAGIFTILSDLGYEIHKLPSGFFYSPYMTGQLPLHSIEDTVKGVLTTVAGNYVWSKFNFQIKGDRGKELSARTSTV